MEPDRKQPLAELERLQIETEKLKAEAAKPMTEARRFDTRQSTSRRSGGRSGLRGALKALVARSACAGIQRVLIFGPVGEGGCKAPVGGRREAVVPQPTTRPPGLGLDCLVLISGRERPPPLDQPRAELQPTYFADRYPLPEFVVPIAIAGDGPAVDVSGELELRKQPAAPLDSGSAPADLAEAGGIDAVQAHPLPGYLQGVPGNHDGFTGERGRGHRNP